jgi:hypothetical protein
MIGPHCRQSADNVSEHEVVLSIGDTTFLDYAKILGKREGYGPIGKGGNGLVLHSALAVSPEAGQPTAGVIVAETVASRSASSRS